MKLKYRLYGLRVVILLSTCFLLSACTSTTKKPEKNVSVAGQTGTAKFTDYVDQIDLSKTVQMPVIVDYVLDISDMAQLRDSSSHVLIARVDSVDRCSMKEEGGMPYTLGKLTVLHSLKGGKIDREITFAKAGGFISRAEYEKGGSTGKILQDAPDAEWVEVKLDNDIRLRAGKTYLFFGSFEGSGSFSIMGVKYGSREIVDQNKQSLSADQLPDLSTLMVRGADDGHLTPLPEIMKQYFP